jgi:hypothetical protein
LGSVHTTALYGASGCPVPGSLVWLMSAQP